MNSKNIALAYCIENINTAEQIENDLSAAVGPMKHIYGTKAKPEVMLTDQLKAHRGPILLLISENFLKTVQCMSGGLNFLHDKKSTVLPIIIDGVKADETSGEMVSTPTEFDRISDIIQYINYWQDQYLDLRRQKRELSDLNEETFNARLRKIREISSETSEFLRILRNMDHLSYEELIDNDYESLFDFVNDKAAWEQFKKQRLSKKIEAGSPASSGRGSIIEVDAGEDEEPDLDLSTIPGIEMLRPSEGPADKPAEENIEKKDPETARSNGAHYPEIADTDHSEEETPTDSGMPEEIEAPNYSTEMVSEPVQEEEDSLLSAQEENEPAPIVESSHQEETGWEHPMPEDEEAVPAVPENIHEEHTSEPAAEHAEALPTTLSQEDALAIMQAGWDLIEEGKVEAALDHVDSAIDDHPDHTDLRYHYALMLAQATQNLAASKIQLNHLLSLSPNHESGLFLMGEIAEIEENFDLARQYYEKVVAINKKYPDVNYRLGVVIAHHFPKEAESAARYLKRAGKQDPDNAEALYQYALLLNETIGKPSKAIKLLKKAISLLPEHPFANYDLALIHHQRGEYEKAHEAYMAAVAVNPELKTTENDLAFTYHVSETAQLEHSTIDALKQNISRLEELINAREEEAHKLKTRRPGYGKTVLITGATSGIGRATAEAFAREGYRLILTGRRAERLKDIRQEFISEYEVDVNTLNFDVRDGEKVREMIANLPEAWKDIDILINNAGKAKGFDPIHRGRLEHWEEMIDTNIKGLLYLTRAISPKMVERGAGHIINICSTAGKEVYPNGNVYCATKHAVDALTQAMRLDLHAHGIRVSQVSPAHVEETEFAVVRFDGDQERAKIYDDFQPLTARDVADAIVYIATRPAHVNIQDVLMMGTQQASSTVIDRSGRGEEEE